MSFDDRGERDLGRDDDFDEDPTAHEGRRNALMAGGVAGVALLMVGAMFWLMSSLPGPKLAIDAVPKPTTTSTTAGTQGTAPQTSSVAPPTIASYTPSTTFSLPPPELPTATAPAATTAPPASAPAATKAPAPAAAPTTPPAAAPPAPSVTNVKLACSRGDGKKVNATLSFTTTTKVSAAVSAGGDVQSKTVGPGDASLSADGRWPGLCIGKINDQVVGPVPAS